MLSEYLQLCSVSAGSNRFPVQFFLERNLDVAEWLDRGFLTAQPVGESVPCRYCGDSARVRPKNADGTSVLIARCDHCGSWELSAAERSLYSVRLNPLFDAIRSALNCRGTIQPGTPAPFTDLGCAPISGQSRRILFLPAITHGNAAILRSLMQANKLNMVLFCGDVSDGAIVAESSPTQLFPLDGLIREGADGTLAVNRQQILQRFTADNAIAEKRKSPKKAPAWAVCALRMKRELEAYFKDVYNSRCYAASAGINPRKFPPMTQKYLADMADTYPAMACRAIRQDPALRVMFKNANDFEYICSYLGKRRIP